MPLYDFASLFDEDEEEEPFNITKAAYKVGGPLYESLYGNETPPLAENDELVNRYMARAREPMPSEAMYQEHYGSRPYESDFKSNIWRKIGAALLGLGGQQGAARDLLHPGFRAAYSDWETQGRMLPSRARAADEGRKRELEAEKFNIVGRAKSRQFEETKRKTSVAEEDRRKKAEDTRKRQEESDKRAEAREERSVRADERAAKSSERAARNDREADERRKRLDQEANEERELKRIKGIESDYSKRKKDFEKEEGNIENAVREEYIARASNKGKFNTDSEGVVTFSPIALEEINREIEKRKAAKRPMMIEFDE